MAHAAPAAAPVFRKLLRFHGSFMIFLSGKIRQREYVFMSHGFAGG
jgi:hypothetical protein